MPGVFNTDMPFFAASPDLEVLFVFHNLLGIATAIPVGTISQLFPGLGLIDIFISICMLLRSIPEEPGVLYILEV